MNQTTQNSAAHDGAQHTPNGAHNGAPPRDGHAPDALHVLLENVPLDLQELNNWVCWRYEMRDGKRTKPLYQPNGTKAASTRRATWRSFDVISKAYATGKWDGIGFVLSGEDGFSGVDLDGMIDAETGEFSDEATAIINLVNSYSEISPSGRGVRIFTRGKLPEGRRRKGKFEVYDDVRYLTVTGHQIDGTPHEIFERTDELAQVHAQYIADKPKAPTAPPSAPGEPLSLSDAELVAKAREARNGAKFSALYDGTDGGGVSEGDASLCALLAFWTQRDGGRMDSLFRASGRMREKWDLPRGNSTYGANEIERAIGRCGEVYDPSIRRARQVRHDDDEADEKAALTLGYPTTDTGNAERFIYQHGQKFLYSAALGWMYYDGTRWTRDELGRVASWEKRTVRSIYAEANAADDDDERKALAKWATKSESAATRKAMMENVIKDGPRAIPSDFDRDKMTLNVANGTLDLRTGELRPHFQGDRISKIGGVIYDPRATCPIFLDSLGMIFNNSDEMIRFIQRAIGYSLTGLTREQCLFIMHGSGANGKSLLLKIISAFMGDYWKHAAASALMQKRGDAIPNDVAALNGARLVTAIESNEGRKFDEATVKAATGDDPLTARFFRKEFFTFTPEFKIFLATNHKPQVVGTDDGIWRRIRMIPFNVRFWDADKGETGPAHLRADKTLGEKILANELSGVLNWALAGCMEYLECGLPSPEAVKGATNAYREEMDPVSQFIDECAVKDDELLVLKGDFHKAFSRWLKDCDAPAMSALSLSLRMKEKGFLETRGTGGVRKWAGIALITPDIDGARVTGSKKEKRNF